MNAYLFSKQIRPGIGYREVERARRTGYMAITRHADRD